jgi:hypothetical protein
MPHWRHMMSSDKLHAADLMGKEHTVVIEKVLQGEYPDLEDAKKKIMKPDVYFRGKKKPLGLNSTNARAISKLIGSSRTEDWIGKAITIYPTTTRAFGEEHECIRVKNKRPNEKDASEAARAPATAPAGQSVSVDVEKVERERHAEQIAKVEREWSELDRKAHDGDPNPRLTDAEKRALELAEAEEHRTGDKK